MATTAIKPGVKTSEFWLALLATASPALVAISAIDIETIPEGQRGWVGIAVAIATAMVGALASMGYSKARTAAKSAAL